MKSLGENSTRIKCSVYWIGCMMMFAVLMTGCTEEKQQGGSVAVEPQLQGITALDAKGLQSARNGNPRTPFPFPGKGKGPFPQPPEPPQTPGVVIPELPAPGGVFSSPLRVHVTDSGWLLVSDTGRQALLRVDPTTLLPDQSLRLQDKPLGVGMLGVEIFVGFAGEQSIRVFSSTGAPRGFLAAPGSIGHPGDIAVDSLQGWVFALDGLAGLVRVYDAAARTLIGTLGELSLQAPSGLAVDAARQELLVSDYGSSTTAASLKIFSYAPGSFGTLAATVSGAGVCGFAGCTGGFSRPRGPAARNGRIYIPDVMYKQVLVYDRLTLNKLTVLGSCDASVSDLRLPSDVSIGAAGDVFVTSTQTQALVVFPGGAP